jgi:hypothetical protein
VLAVGVNRDRPVREREGGGKPCQQSGSFALILLMVSHGYARKRSENRRSGVCRTIIDHDDRQPELKTFLDDPTHLRTMVINGNNNGTAKRCGHEKRNPGTTMSISGESLHLYRLRAQAE